EPNTAGEKYIVAIIACDIDASFVPISLEKFMFQGFLFIIISLAIANITQLFIVRHSLAPLTDLGEGLRKIGDGDLS
ncbi:methyl-accepting chemotaxis protein, partial [Bacillus cereus]|nr:methyl-accepting chemotaxis protein [Bacillus cereus]